jgi:hypothetical protein
MSPIIEQSRKQGGRLYMGNDKFAVSEYDFAVDGGAVGSITMRGDALPQNAIITQGIIQVDTILGGGTGTDNLSITIESVNDLQTTAARNGSPWSTTGPKWTSNGAHGGTVSQPILTTQKRTPTFVIAGTPLTSGKFRLITEYVEI